MSDNSSNSESIRASGNRKHRFDNIKRILLRRTRQYPEDSNSQEGEPDDQVWYPCGCKVIHTKFVNIGNPGKGFLPKWDDLFTIESTVKLCEAHTRKAMKYIRTVRPKN